MGTLRIEDPGRKRALQEENNQITLLWGRDRHHKRVEKVLSLPMQQRLQYVQDGCENLSKDPVLGSVPHEH